MIRVYLVRHGIAVDGAEDHSLPDGSRALTGKGRHRFRRLAKAFAHEHEAVDVLCTSPLVRAVQTAEILADALGEREVSVLHELLPGGSPAALFAAAAKRVKDGQGIALVGHDPLMSTALAALAKLPPDEARAIDFKKGSIVRVDVEGALEAGAGVVQWWMKPKTTAVLEGIPLAPAEKEKEKEKKKPAK